MRLHRLIRNRAIGLSRRALASVTSWRWSREPEVVTVDAVSRRLELLLAAMHGRRFTVGDGSARPGGASADHQPDIVLPTRLVAHDGIERARERYRLLAVEASARILRGTTTHALPRDPLERDLYMIAEGAAVDRAVARMAPGLAAALADDRRKVLAGRPPLERTSGSEREVESLLQQTLRSDLANAPSNVPDATTPDESLQWAREQAARIVSNAVNVRYRPIRVVARWQLSTHDRRDTLEMYPSHSSFGDQHTNAVKREADGEEGNGDARSATQGASRGDDGSAAQGATTSGQGVASVGDVGGAAAGEQARGRGGVRYREWDEYAGRYRPAEVTVHDAIVEETPDDWAVATLHEHAPLVRQIRARFEPLRAQRARLRAQRTGDELDLDACVAALVELTRGRVPTDRLYQVTRPERRTMAILLLVDVSGSTDSPVSPGRTVLDVERMTVLLASEALDALGDPYAVLAFSGSGRHDVRVDTVKSFAEHDPARVRRRVSALVSAHNTRLGAAVRHATALLNAQPAERRLLLILSDGQPNDVGGYQGTYAVGDSRQAVLEARAAGVHPFCLTVDRDEHEYLPHLFGVSGYRILRSPAQLPAALLQVVARMLPG